ncbi:3-dehydroquinate synthase [Truepera radiovictrix]|uniref:3-dehydroquinate synthase n=1 Tax=Truepera radiovictrix (strain DSM 17093 / CIP 108686 / LMG 22925 / RQ-24) TaxID=649638 RepID=D7CQK5_TRURR|nr:3-dehydroquinate synthase [Truepera radiovictrix]ADI14989.1 3-dehydroquinate synthase [Truepera radiovictrix DSM 17093]WMT56456.1 3-dehydroquinate synthase [Truepera radiovictrix]
MTPPLRPITQEIAVTFRYPVHFTRGLFRPENPLLAQTLARADEAGPKKVLAVVDEGVARHHPELTRHLSAYLAAHPGLELVAAPLVVPGGEAVKNSPETVHALQRAVHTHGIDRHSYLLAVGGGAVLDMAGYAAATAHRGVRLVRVPTTVLAQNDSAVGVKNGVNAFCKKNFLGTFAPPYAVLCDLDVLTTLEQRDWVGGLAEAVKVALLKDARFFDFLEAHAAALRDRDAEAMAWAIYRCAELHLEHIATAGDPFEFGSSRPLDFGHWAAHKLEAVTDYRLRHGEAVAIGIALDATYAHLSGRLPRGDWQRILALFDALGLATYTPELETGALLTGLEEFREHLGGRLTIMLLDSIGRGVEVHDMDHATIRRAAQLLGARAKGETWTQDATFAAAAR